MMKTLALLSMISLASLAHADMPSLLTDPEGYARHSINYWQSRINELGLPAKLVFDEKSLGKIDETRAVRVKNVSMGIEDGFEYLLGKTEYKALLIASVKSIRVVHDDKLTERDVLVEMVGGVLTVRVNLVKFVSSNAEPDWSSRIRWGIPAIVEHDRAAGIKRAESELREHEKRALQDSPPRKVKMSIRWDDAKGTLDWEHGRGDLFRYVANLMRNLDFQVSKSKGASRIQKLTLGVDKKKDAEPKLVVKGNELVVIVSYEMARQATTSFDWKEAFARTFK